MTYQNGNKARCDKYETYQTGPPGMKGQALSNGKKTRIDKYKTYQNGKMQGMISTSLIKRKENQD